MEKDIQLTDRRNFLKKSSILGLGTAGLIGIPNISEANPNYFTTDDDINIVGTLKKVLHLKLELWFR